MKNLINEFSWDINQDPIYNAKGNIIEGSQHITRNDTGKTISVMSSGYTPVTTAQFSEIAHTIAKKVGFEFEGFEDWSSDNIGAKKQMITGQLKSDKKLHIGGSLIEGYLTLGVGFDGNRSFFVGHSNRYHRCSNEFGDIITDFRARLTKNVMQKIEMILKEIGKYKAYEEDLYSSFQQFEKVQISDSIVNECISRLVGLTKEERLDSGLIKTAKKSKILDLKMVMATEIDDLGGNAWGMFNGVTKYTTHIAKARSENHFGNMFGSKKDMNKIGYDMCMELAMS